MDQDEKVRENRLRRVAQRRGYELRKSRRRDPLALDYGEWYLERLSIGDGAAGLSSGITCQSLDGVEAFLDHEFAHLTSREGVVESVE